MSSNKKTEKVEEEKKKEEEREEEEKKEEEEEEELMTESMKPVEEVQDIPTEMSLADLAGQVLILTHAEIDELPEYNMIHMVLQDLNGNTILARTTGKAVYGTIKKLLRQGLNNGKGFKFCVKTIPSGKGNPTIILASPHMCEKK